MFLCFEMLKTNSYFWLPTILIVTHNFGLSGGIAVEKWIEQFQDHFDYDNGKTWLMRYYENAQFYDTFGPIFINIGGECAITPSIVNDATSLIYKMAKAHKAMMYSIEHRYYGKSHPVPDTSLENLRYLSIPQVLADIAWFIELKKRELNSLNAFVMVLGGSYAGNLAAWMRVKYPNLVQGALASSAPIYLKADYSEYYEFVENSIRQYDENCAMNIKEAFSALGELLKSPANNLIRIKNDFKMCRIPDLSQPSEIPLMISFIANLFSSTVNYNKIEINGKTSIENLCIFMGKNKTISSYYALTEIFKMKYVGNKPCIYLAYNAAVEQYLQISWKSESVTNRLWLYQTCTELGYYTTMSSPESIFGSLVPLKFFIDLCGHVFTTIFNLDYLNHNIRRINRLYNSKLSTTTNIIFTNGDLDAWRSLSVLSDLNADSPAILINGASHCGFLQQNEAQQRDGLIVARCQVFFIIYDWLYMYKNMYG